MTSLDPLATTPAPRGIFTKLSPVQFRAVVRKAQGFTDAENAAEGGITRKTVSKYIENARGRLGFYATQDLVWAYYREYAPELLNPSIDNGVEEVSS